MTSIVQLRLGGRVNSRAITSVPEYDCAFLAETEAIQRLPTEPIGSATVTFTGINAGTEIRVYLSDGTEVAGIESCADDQVLMWDVYATGSANNVVTIKLVNVAYRLKEFSYTTLLGTQSIPIQQEVDPWYKNP